MSKQKVNKDKKTLKGWATIAGVTILLILGVTIYQTFFNKLDASTVVKKGDFRLTATNKWDATAKKNFADLKWDTVPSLSQGGYQLYQSADQGITWENRSVNYGKEIRVLNVFPDLPGSNTLKNWMDNPKIGLDLIKVTPVRITDFNNNPDKYLMDANNEYIYDIIMFGTWDGNDNRDLSEKSGDASEKFLNSGRGILLGHDTVRTTNAGSGTHKNFNRFAKYLGTNVGRIYNTSTFTGSAKVKIINDGYMMKYPHELSNSAIFNIPATHVVNYIDPKVSKVWMDFAGPPWSTFNVGPTTEGKYISNYYLATTENIGQIQTGHSNGQSTDNEMKILVNSLYNLAQVSLDTFASDQTVKDDIGPEKPAAPIIRAGKNGSLNIKTDAVDRGKEYQWYVDANTKANGIKKSDTVKEMIVSNVAGYFYEITDSPTSSLKATVEGYKDSFGRIDKSKYSAYVAPEDASVTYITETNFTVPGAKAANKYLHILAVDRANNVGEIRSEFIDDLDQYVDFTVERTANEAKLVDLKFDNYVDGKMKSMEIQIPKTAEIKDFSKLTLPSGWYSFENSQTDKYRTFTFAIEKKNDLATLSSFIKDLKITLNEPVNQEGSINLVFHEKIYTSWIDGQGKPHYYTLVRGNESWFNAYNSAKKMSYKGLNGYLATLTSEEEHTFIFENIAKNPGWLGGTRGLINDTTKIKDDHSIPVDASEYNVSGDDWYWVNGPEAGQVFYKGKVQKNGSFVNGMYAGWAKIREPNNTWKTALTHGKDEYTLQFALKDTQYVGKDWNDLPGDLINNAQYNEGYYVEFSEYGNQKEKEEITDVSWEADIPQKISLQAYDEKGASLAAGDLLYDQNLRINNVQQVTPKKIPLYEFIKVTTLDGADRSLNYDISKGYQGGKLIYRRNAAALNIRQVVLDQTAKVEVPTQGSVRIVGKDNPENKVTPKIISGLDSQKPEYTTVEMELESDKEILTVTPLNLGFYKVVGYVLTSEKTEHQALDKEQGEITIETEKTPEFWLTIYVAPDINTSVYLSMVNDKLQVYYANIKSFTVYIDGEKYKVFDNLNDSPIIEMKTLNIPLDQARNKIMVMYKDSEGNDNEAIWNNKEDWDTVTPKD